MPAALWRKYRAVLQIPSRAAWRRGAGCSPGAVQGIVELDRIDAGRAAADGGITRCSGGNSRNCAKRLQRSLIRTVQVGILNSCLFLLYVIGFGLTKLAMLVFARKRLLGPWRTPSHRDRVHSYWQDAAEYDEASGRFERQS